MVELTVEKDGNFYIPIGRVSIYPLPKWSKIQKTSLHSSKIGSGKCQTRTILNFETAPTGYRKITVIKGDMGC
jgi:hypothetical protein